MEKIKIGLFIIPHFFTEDMKDLISGMLNPEPSLRYTISQIKSHPFFRFNCPEEYIFPSPLPVPIISEPINLNLIQPQIYTTLMQLGFEDENELNNELSSNDHSLVKVFYHLLISQNFIKNLTWDIPNNINNEKEEIFLQNENSFVMNSQVDMFGRRKKFLDISSPFINSFAERANWDHFSQNKESFEYIQPIVNIQLQIEELMTILQKYLSNNGFEWFHPDDYTLYSRHLNNNIFLNIVAEYEHNGWIQMILQFKNTSQNFVLEFSQIIMNLISF